MNKRHTGKVLLLVLTSSLFCNSYAAEEVDVLDLRIVPAEDFKDIFSDTVVTIKDEVNNETYNFNFYEDGLVTTKKDGVKRKGIWYIDENDNHCIKWNRKNKSNCALIMQDDEGNWVKVKDDEIIRSYKKIKPLKKKQ